MSGSLRCAAWRSPPRWFAGGVADYGSPDAVPVRLVVMIVARTDQHELYLRVLSRLSSLLKEDGFRERVFGCADAAGLCAAFTED